MASPRRHPSNAWEHRIIAEAEAFTAVKNMELGVSSETLSEQIQKSRVDREQYHLFSALRAEKQHLASQLHEMRTSSSSRQVHMDSMQTRLDQSRGRMNTLKQLLGELGGRINVRKGAANHWEVNQADKNLNRSLELQVNELDDRFVKHDDLLHELRGRASAENRQTVKWENEAQQWEQQVSQKAKQAQYWIEKATELEVQLDSHLMGLKREHVELRDTRSQLIEATTHCQRLQEQRDAQQQALKLQLAQLGELRNRKVESLHREAESALSQVTKLRVEGIASHEKFRQQLHDQQIKIHHLHEESMKSETTLEDVLKTNASLKKQLSTHGEEHVKEMNVLKQQFEVLQQNLKNSTLENERLEKFCSHGEAKYEKLTADHRKSTEIQFKLNAQTSQLATVQSINDEHQTILDKVNAELAKLDRQTTQYKQDSEKSIADCERDIKRITDDEGAVIKKKVTHCKEVGKVALKLKISLIKWRCLYSSLELQCADWFAKLLHCERFDYWMETRFQRQGKYKIIIQRVVAKIILENRTKANIWSKMLSKAKDKGLDQFKKSVQEGVDMIEKTEQKREKDKDSQHSAIELKLVQKRLAKKMAADRKRVLEMVGGDTKKQMVKTKKWKAMGWKMIEEKRRAKMDFMKLAKSLKSRGADERQKIADEMKQAELQKIEQLSNEKDRQQTVMRTKIAEKKKAKQVAATVRKMVVSGNLGDATVIRPSSP